MTRTVCRKVLPFALAPVVALGLALAAAAEPEAPGSGTPDGTASPVADLWLAGERITVSRQALIADTALAPDQDVRVREIGRDAHTSHHVVGLRRGERLHRHDRHDQLVVILRGHGRMRVGDTTREVGEGSVLYVPRGVAHAFTNGAAADTPAFAHVVYTPPFDGEDRVPVEE